MKEDQAHVEFERMCLVYKDGNLNWSLASG